MTITSLLADPFVKEGILSCQHSLECLAGVGVENFLTLALTYGDLSCDVSPCSSCPIGEKMVPLYTNQIEQTNTLLAHLNLSHKVVLSDTLSIEKKSNDIDRRKFLEKFDLKSLITAKGRFEDALQEGEYREFNLSEVDPKRLAQKEIPQKRLALYNALKTLPPVSKIINDDDISFSSYKSLDFSSCSNCGLCHRLCPTGALSTSKWGADIFFNPLACVKCNLCHEACETQCLHLSSIYHLNALFAPQQLHLAHHEIKRCTECGMIFKYEHQGSMCPRCMMLDDEATELVGF
jgi:ferredoxin